MQLFYRLAATVPLALLLLSVSSFAAEQPKAQEQKAKAPEVKAKPAEQKLLAILVWGTDDDKPENSLHELSELESPLKDKFKHIFKWKNYFQVGERERFSIRGGETKHIKMSRKCQLEVSQTERALGVKLIGDGKPVFHRTQPMPLNDTLILAGDDKNATAWFVVIKPE